MRKRILLFSLILCCILIGQPVFAQMDIRIKLTGITCDSVRIQSFNWKKKSGTNLVRPYQNEVQFKEKTALKPGVYWITTDTTYMILFMFQCHSPKSSHPPPHPQSP